MPLLKENDIFANNYRLISHLGDGGFSEVWKAEYTLGGTTVALKIYAPGKGLPQDGIEVLSKEYALTFQLVHAHLLKAVHFDVYENCPYLVLPFCAGGSLNKYVDRNGELSQEQVARLMVEIGGALHYLHTRQPSILHQDIKPDNILIDDDGHFFLSDFGISTKTRKTLARSTGANYSLTVAFAPPEKFDEVPQVLPAGDIFSFGVMLYEVCTGELPWDGKGGVMLLSGAKVPHLPAAYPARLNVFVRQCLNPNPALRPMAAAIVQFGTQFQRDGFWPDYTPPVAPTLSTPNTAATFTADQQPEFGTQVPPQTAPPSPEDAGRTVAFTPPVVPPPTPGFEPPSAPPPPAAPSGFAPPPAATTAFAPPPPAAASADQATIRSSAPPPELADAPPVAPPPPPSGPVADRSTLRFDQPPAAAASAPPPAAPGGYPGFGAQAGQLPPLVQAKPKTTEHKSRSPLAFILIATILVVSGISIGLYYALRDTSSADDTELVANKDKKDSTDTEEGRDRSKGEGDDNTSDKKDPAADKGSGEPGKKISAPDEPVKPNTNKPKGEYKEMDMPGLGKYTGYTVNGKRDGTGTMVYKYGDKYIGGWSNDKKSGSGVYTWKNGDRYDGTFVNDVMEGYGTYSFKNGDRYVGQFKNDKMHGNGVFTFADGRKCEAVWVSGQKTGPGTFYFKNGDKYVGNFRNDVRNGYGTMYYANGKVEEGYWEDDVFVGR